MISIKKIVGEEILDSRGFPTIKITTILSDGSCGSASIPSGASTGSLEAIELRDGDNKRYFGKGVNRAIANTDLVSDMLSEVEPFDQGMIDKKIKELDGTENYSKIGANTSLGASISVAKAAANHYKIPLYKYLGGINATVIPVPMLNILNGGSHADNSVDFQEYMIMPNNFPSFKEAIRASSEVYQNLKMILKKDGHVTSLGDEGGFAPNLKNNEEPIIKILQAIEASGYKPAEDFNIALDPASSEFYSHGLYHIKSENKKVSSDDMIDYYEKLCDKYPIVSIEDGLAETDWDGWSKLTKRLGNKIQIVGDDIFVTNKKILQKAIDLNISNSILIKLNQIGTITETIDAVRLAQKSSYTTVISHRSGETEDTFIADFAVAMNAGQIKTGATARGERIAKYNRLLHIESSISNSNFG